MVPTWRNSFFLNLEKTRNIQGQVRTDIYNDKQTNDETEISTHIYSFFNYLFRETSFSNANYNTILFPKRTKKCNISR